MQSPASPPAVRLTPATIADLDQLSGWMHGLRQDDPMPAETLADEATARQAMAVLLADPALGTAWLIRREETPVGYAVLTYVHSIEFGGRCAFVDEFYVEPTARGAGVGRAALMLIEKAATAAGVRMLLLEVTPENERAVQLYQLSGFGLRKYGLMSKQLDVRA